MLSLQGLAIGTQAGPLQLYFLAATPRVFPSKIQGR